MHVLQRVLEGKDENLTGNVLDVFKGEQAQAKNMAERSLESGYLKDALFYLTIASESDPVDYALMLKLGLWRSLMLFGVLQMASNVGFWWLATVGKGQLPGLTIPPFDLKVVQLAQATPVDGGLLLVIAAENISGGMGTAAFVALLMALCNQRFTATQFALLSAFASVGRVWVGPLAGVLAESIGWPRFFVVSTLLAAPALAMLWVMRGPVRSLEVDPDAGRTR
jgi:PAT family beta-lactamase induction signal transducer AmpG